jgi:hypothetical protein
MDRRKGLLSFILSLVISAVLLTWLYRQIDPALLRRTLSSLHVPALFAFMAFVLTGTWLRAWRYKLLLAPVDIGWVPVFLVTFIRNLFVDLLPARIGSLSYVYVLNVRLGLRFDSAASSFVVSVVLDFLTLSPFLIVSLVFVGAGGSAATGFWLLILSLVFLGLVFLILWRIVPLSRLLVNGLGHLLRAFGLEARVWAHKALDAGHETVTALSEIRDRGVYWPLFRLSLLLRATKYGALYSLLFSLLHPHGFTLRSLSPAKTILGITGAEFTSILPVKGLAGFGTWESAWALAFRLMDFDPELAVMSGIGVHLITNFFEYSLGIAALLIVFSPMVRHLMRPPSKS